MNSCIHNTSEIELPNGSFARHAYLGVLCAIVSHLFVEGTMRARKKGAVNDTSKAIRLVPKPSNMAIVTVDVADSGREAKRVWTF